jgi:hypothetical protein
MIIRRHTFIAIASLAIAFAFLVPFWWTTQIPVSQLSNVVVNRSVKPGDDLIIQSSVVRTKLCATKIERTIFDGDGFRWVMVDIDYASAPGPLGPHSYRQTAPVPKSAASGDATFYIGLVWNCPFSIFPLKEVIGPLHFTIEPK